MKFLIVITVISLITACGSGGGSDSTGSGQSTFAPSVADAPSNVSAGATPMPQPSVTPVLADDTVSQPTPPSEVAVEEEPTEQATIELVSEPYFDFRSVTSVSLNVNKASQERVYIKVCQLRDGGRRYKSVFTQYQLDR